MSAVFFLAQNLAASDVTLTTRTLSNTANQRSVCDFERRRDA